MNVLFGILFCIIVIFLVFYVIVSEKREKRHTRQESWVRERLDEIEKYAYTDIRELLDFLDKIKLDYKKYETTRKNK